jgi:hypothetical protein
MFLVQDLGPTQFLIAVEGDAAKFKVSLGSLVTCTCKVCTPPPSSLDAFDTRLQSRSKPCLHSLFVMHEVFRVPIDNPICWQLALIDPEIEQLIRGRFNSDVYATRFLHCNFVTKHSGMSTDARKQPNLRLMRPRTCLKRR